MKKMNFLRKTALALALGACASFGHRASANTITPSFSGFIAGTAITYAADHTSGEIKTGDGFTIFDIDGFAGLGSVVAPLGWTASAGALGSPWGVAPLGADSALVNITFTYTAAPTLQSLGITPLGLFIIGTTATFLVVDDWTSRDHLIGNPAIVGDGGLATPHRDNILVPGLSPGNVPDGGLTVTLLGAALIGLAALRRKMTV